MNICTMLDSLIADAEAGRSVYITEVRTMLDESSECRSLTLIITSGMENYTRRYSLKLPPLEVLTEAQYDFVREYLCARVYNILSTFGGSDFTFAVEDSFSGAARLIESLNEAFGVIDTKRNRRAYGRALNVAERMCDAVAGMPPGSSRFVFNACRDDEPAVAGGASGAETAAPPCLLTEALSGLHARLGGKSVMGMDIGGSDIKIVVVRDERIIAYKEYDWFPANFSESSQLVDPILLLTRWARARAAVEPHSVSAELLDSVCGASAPISEIERAVAAAEEIYGGALPGLDAVGLCFPDVVVRNKIVGGEVYKTRGIRNNPDIDYELDFAVLTDLDVALSTYCRPGVGPRIINDGPMAAFTAAVESAAAGDEDINAGVFAHTLGTELGTGWIDVDGTIPEIPLEVYNYVIDLGIRPERRYQSDDPRSVNNFNTEIPGTLQKFLGQSGVFRLALRYFPSQRPDLYRELFEKGFIVDEGEAGLIIPVAPKDMRKPLLEHLMALPERENCETCNRIFRTLGESLAITYLETEDILGSGIDRRILFGRLVKSSRCFELMCEGARSIAPRLRLEVADDSSASTPLMRQLRDEGRYSVAQFAQAVGAVYYAVSSE